MAQAVTKNSPEVVADAIGQLWLVYGGAYGGITLRQLTPAGTALATTNEVSMGVDNYYTNPYIYFHNGYFYEMLTAGARYTYDYIQVFTLLP